MVARRKVAGLALVITGIIVVLTGSVVIAGEETLGTGFIVQGLIGAAIIVEGAVLLVLPRNSPSGWKGSTNLTCAQTWILIIVFGMPLLTVATD